MVARCPASHGSPGWCSSNAALPHLTAGRPRGLLGACAAGCMCCWCGDGTWHLLGEAGSFMKGTHGSASVARLQLWWHCHLPLAWQALISRSQQTHNVEYIKNITVKYLETKDATLLRALSIALQISPEEMARVERGQAKKVSLLLP